MYAITVLNEDLAGMNYDLTWAINAKDKELEKSCRTHIADLEQAIKILSNEPKVVRNDECKKKVCDYGFESPKLCNFECSLTGCQLI